MTRNPDHMLSDVIVILLPHLPFMSKTWHVQSLTGKSYD